MIFPHALKPPDDYDGERLESSLSLRVVRTASLVLLLPAVLSSPAMCDDAGLISARLIEHTGNEYSIETDVPPQMVSLLRGPILPPRFTLDSEPEYLRNGVLLTVRYLFRGGGPLTAEDVLVLPWNRTGLILTAIWQNGPHARGLFARRPEGISVPIRTLKGPETSAKRVFFDQIKIGLLGRQRGLAVWLLAASLTLLSPWRRVVRTFWMLLTGYASALVLSDFWRPALTTSLVDGMLMITALLLARQSALSSRVPTTMQDNTVDEGRPARFGPILFLAGFGHGLFHVHESALNETLRDHLPVALIAVVLGLAIFYVGVASLVSVVAWLTQGRPRIRLLYTTAIGSLAVVGLFATVDANRLAGDSHATESDQPQLLPIFAQNSTQSAAQSLASRNLTAPIMVFLVIEPHEIRFESLVNGEAIAALLNIQSPDNDRIEIADQEHLKNRVLEAVTGRVRMTIDGSVIQSQAGRAEFLSLDVAGPMPRSEPIPEYFGKTVLGLSFAYSTINIPNEVTFDWHDWPISIARIPITLADPLRVVGGTMTHASRSATWSNTLGSLAQPDKTAVAASQNQRAVLSAVLILFVLTMATLCGFQSSRSWPTCVGSGCTLFALAFFPVVRTSIPAPLLDRLAMSDEQAGRTVEQLLTNVYHSFSFRDEGMVYDRLAASVTGEQLSDIYLSHRKSMELGELRGLRVRVDSVELGQVESIETADNGGLAVLANWTVSGSVTHFGHTHYRRNRYDAWVHIVSTDGVWKIVSIDFQDEQRVL